MKPLQDVCPHAAGVNKQKDFRFPGMVMPTLVWDGGSFEQADYFFKKTCFTPLTLLACNITEAILPRVYF